MASAAGDGILKYEDVAGTAPQSPGAARKRGVIYAGGVFPWMALTSPPGYFFKKNTFG